MDKTSKIHATDVNGKCYGNLFSSFLFSFYSFEMKEWKNEIRLHILLQAWIDKIREKTYAFTTIVFNNIAYIPFIQNELVTSDFVCVFFKRGKRFIHQFLFDSFNKQVEDKWFCGWCCLRVVAVDGAILLLPLLQLLML